MKRLSAFGLSLLLVSGLAVLGCAPQMSNQGGVGWITLLDGANPKTLDNWNRSGDVNWRAEDGAIVADKGKGGHLVSKNTYKDFQIRAEFWADQTTNSGMPKRGGKWNNYKITAKGAQLTLVFNGMKTVDVQNSQFTEGPLALQFANREKGALGGAIKWRKVQIRPL